MQRSCNPVFCLQLSSFILFSCTYLEIWDWVLDEGNYWLGVIIEPTWPEMEKISLVICPFSLPGQD